MAVKYQYEKLKTKYMDFQQPRVLLTVNGKTFSENKKGLILKEVEVELSTGYEASAVTFSVYQVYDEERGMYELSKFKNYALLGSSVSVALGYSGQMTEVFVGFIASVRLVCDAGMPHHIEVTAMDLKGMMMAGASLRQFQAKNYGDAVKELFSEALYQKMQGEGIFRKMKVSATPDKTMQENAANRVIEMLSESDYEFVRKAAKHFNYEFYVDCGDVIFRKAKAATESCLIELGSRSGILYYNVQYDMTGLVKTVEVRGIDTAKGKTVDASVSVSNKISTGNKAKALLSRTKKVIVDAGADSKDTAKKRAESAMESIAYRYGTLECECVGLPEIAAGHFIRIKLLENGGSAVKTDFYVTNVRHLLSDQDGYKTYITACAASLS